MRIDGEGLCIRHVDAIEIQMPGWNCWGLSCRDDVPALQYVPTCLLEGQWQPLNAKT